MDYLGFREGGGGGIGIGIGGGVRGCVCWCQWGWERRGGGGGGGEGGRGKREEGEGGERGVRVVVGDDILGGGKVVVVLVGWLDGWGLVRFGLVWKRRGV